MSEAGKTFLNPVLIITLVIAAFLLFSPLAFSQSIPPYIYYQGRLLDQATGAPVNQIKSITFSLYNTDQGGIPIYQQTQDINVTNGVFSVYLGQGEGNYNGNPVADGIPSGVFIEHSARYLGIRIADSQAEMTPRQPIASAAYAYKADKAREADLAIKAELASNANDAERLTGKVPGEMNGIATLDEKGTIPSSQLPGITVDSSGNVGIGTSSPGVRLEVNGALKTSDLQLTEDAQGPNFLKIGDILIQWGEAVFSSGDSGPIVIYLPINYIDAAYAISAHPLHHRYNNGYSLIWEAYEHGEEPRTDRFALRRTGSSLADNACWARWMTIGRWR